MRSVSTVHRKFYGVNAGAKRRIMPDIHKIIQRLLLSLVVVLILWACSSGNSQQPSTPSNMRPVQPSVTPIVTTPMIALPAPIVAPLQPTPSVSLSGATVDSGPFTFYLFLYKDEALGKNPVAPSLYSDMNGIGAYMFWKYNGADSLKSVEEYWGAQPKFNLLNTYPEIIAGQTGGRDGGIILPVESKAGDKVDVVIKLKITTGEYGAFVSFTLQNGANGFEPSNISIAKLDDPASDSGTVSWSEQWSSMKPFHVMASSFQLAPDHKTYTDTRGFAIDYPADWLISAERGLVLASSELAPKNHSSATIYAAKIDIIAAHRSSLWTIVDEINAFQKEQAAISTLIEIQNLLLEGQVPAARLILQNSTGQSRVVLTVINDLSVRVHSVGDAQMIDAVTNTLRAIQ